MLLSRNESAINAAARACASLVEEQRMELARGNPNSYRQYRVWTDDFSNLFQVIR